MFRRSGWAVRGRANVRHLNTSRRCPLSGEFDNKCCPTLRTFEIDRSVHWVHLNLTVQGTGFLTRVPGIPGGAILFQKTSSSTQLNQTYFPCASFRTRCQLLLVYYQDFLIALNALRRNQELYRT